ncbi:hypothetical protein SRS16P2_00466 (plasmid) [Variovorax sp. SRS16]|nr:hypothetical protein [Variovorax sp. SRS16]VTU46065.1 hypothetical protein SRS16P2_00466 [Variovorax sp. SRS16]
MNLPTLLRMPSWLGLGIHEEHDLPFAPRDYEVPPVTSHEPPL